MFITTQSTNFILYDTRYNKLNDCDKGPLPR